VGVVAVGAVAGLAYARKAAPAPAAAAATVPPLVVQPGPTLTVTTVSQVKALVGGARLERGAVIDGGAVRLAPAAGQPALDEVHAIRLWAAVSPAGGQQTVAEPVAFLADVTLAAPLQPAGAMFGAVKQPRFVHRLAWVVVWSQQGPIYFCPYGTVHPTTKNTTVASSHPAPDAIYGIQMIAADASGESVVYSTATVACGPRLAHADIAVYDLSLPWHATSGAGGARASVVVPDCAVLGASSSVGSPTSVMLQVSAEVLMVRPPCEGPSHGGFPVAVPGLGAVSPSATATRALEHGPTGLQLGRVTSTGTGSSDGSLSYFDGAEHTLFA